MGRTSGVSGPADDFHVFPVKDGSVGYSCPNSFRLSNLMATRAMDERTDHWRR